MNKEITFLKPVIYPNPASDVLNIANISNIHNIEILNLSGTIVWSSAYIDNEFISINISEMERDIIIEGTVITRKFIKN